jgi:membrane protease subunit HflC
MRRWWWWGLLAAAVLAIAATSFFSVGEGESAIVLRFGDPVRTVESAGLAFKLPFPVDRVETIDRRLLVLDIPEREESPREFLTLDKKNVEVSTYTCWRVRDPLKFLETTGSREAARSYLTDIVLSELGKEIGQHELSALISVDPGEQRVDALTRRIREASDVSAAREAGLEVVDFKIKRVNFPDQNRSSVFERMRAERKRMATRYRSEGEEEARAIRAEAEREAAELLAKAHRQAAEIEGNAEAEAARIYNEAYGQSRDFYELLRTLESYEKTMSEGTTLVLPPDMPYLEMLADPERAGVGGW